MSRLSLRIPESLHRQLAAEADEEGVSLNQYLVYLLAQRSAPSYVVAPVDSEAVGEQRSAYSSLLTQLGKASYREIRAALEDRAPAEPESGLTPEVLERLRQRIEAEAGARERRSA
jgi:hypothetical protein